MPSITGHARRLWKLAQAGGLLITAALLAGFVWRPEMTLSLFWNVLIPLLPATFLLSPLIWRSVCPIATVNMMSNGWFGRRRLSVRSIPTASMAGIVVFAALVPARHVVFNTNGLFLAATVAVVLLAALVLGARYDAKAGFCNSICPVLPIERLYGQHPLVQLNNPRCHDCRLCTPKGCVDLAPRKSLQTTMGASHRTWSWVKTPTGIFSAALPGFIAGYFFAEDSSLGDAIGMYARIGLFSVASYLIVAGGSAFFGWTSPRVLPWIGALAVALYYGFAAPQMAGAIGLGRYGTWGIRAAAFALIAFWLWRALKHAPRRRAAIPRPDTPGGNSQRPDARYRATTTAH